MNTLDLVILANSLKKNIQFLQDILVDISSEDPKTKYIAASAIVCIHSYIHNMLAEDMKIFLLEYSIEHIKN